MAPVILFPHTHIAVSNLETILARFGELTICQPWFMEGPIPATEGPVSTLVHIQHPHETLKPKGDFRRLVSEYQMWLRQNRDKGYGAFLAASRQRSHSEDTPWEIRQLISRAGKERHPDPHEDRTLKWHLTLHLAREFEESRFETERLLKKLKLQKSPLEGALEEPPTQRFFEDTPLMEAQLQVDEYHLRQVFEAWFGLFGKYLSDEETLITLDPQVLIYASEVLESEETISKAEGEKDMNDPVKKGLSGRTIILMED